MQGFCVTIVVTSDDLDSIMAEREFFTLIEDRLISGRGFLELPRDPSVRWLRLWVDVIRFPDPDYLNGKYNPSQGLYAYMLLMYQDYVVQEYAIKYPRTVWDFPSKEPGSFLAAYQICSDASLEGKLNVIIEALGGVIPPGGDIIRAEPVQLGFDSIRFVCRDQTGFQLQLYQLNKDQGCPEAAPNPKLNLPPANVLPVIPTDSAFEVSAPYESPDDNGNTIPFNGDPVPPPDPCQGVGLWFFEYQVNFTLQRRAIAGRETDVFEWLVEPIPGCSSPSVLRMNGEIAFSVFSCSGNVNVPPVFTYLGEGTGVPVGALFVVNEQYPECTNFP